MGKSRFEIAIFLIFLAFGLALSIFNQPGSVFFFVGLSFLAFTLIGFLSGIQMEVAEGQPVQLVAFDEKMETAVLLQRASDVDKGNSRKSWVIPASKLPPCEPGVWIVRLDNDRWAIITDVQERLDDSPAKAALRD